MAAEQPSYEPYVARSAIAADPRLAELLSEQPALNSLPPVELIGRQTEMQQAIALWQQLRSETDSARVLAIVGQAGVGKSAFALHLAQRIKPISPPIYFNLRFDRPVASAAIAAQIQSALPADDRPLLILLDNLEDQTLIRPLLKLGDRCLLLITSRQPLAESLTLELPALSESDAIDLLQAIAPSKLVQADRDIARSIVRCCDALPLALRIVGGLLHQPQLHLSDCLQRLKAERQRCEQNHLSYPAIRASFNLSYPNLEARSARLLRLLGLLLEPNVTLKTAAALLETSIESARASIADLLRLRLLESASKERYRLPDLLRLFAKSQLAIEESTETRQAARLRLAQAYQDTAEVMSVGLDASRRQQLAALDSRVDEQSLLRNAQSWFAIERSNLLTILDWAFQAQAWGIGLPLANDVALFLTLSGEWTAAETMLLQAIAASETLGDRLQAVQLLDRLGDIYLQQGRWEKAKAPYQQALDVLRDLQEPLRESQTLANLGLVYLKLGDRETAATLWATALTRLPAASTSDLARWMQTTEATLLETLLLQPDDRQASRKFLGAIGEMVKRLLF